MKFYSLIIFLLANGFNSIYAQYHFEEPVKINSNVNWRAEQSLPLYDVINKKLYFARVAHKSNVGGRFGGFDIWVSERKSENYFTKAQNVKELNDTFSNAVIGFMSDNQGVFLLNAYDEEQEIPVTGISYALFEEGGKFSKPQLTTIQTLHNLPQQTFWGASFNSVNDVLIISMKGDDSNGLEDLYVSFKFEGKNRYFNGDSLKNNSWWSEPINLGPMINTPQYEISPFLLDDGKTLFFTSKRADGLGDADIYYSERLDDTWTNWTYPVNLGEPINSDKFDAYFSLTSEGEAFFSSNRTGGFADIFYAKITSEDSLANRQKEEQYLSELNKIERIIQFDEKQTELMMKEYDLLVEVVGIVQSEPGMSVVLDAYKTTDTTVVNTRTNNVISQLLKMGMDSTQVKYDPEIFNALPHTIGLKFYKTH